MRLTFVLAALGIPAFALAVLSFGATAQAKTVEIETGNFYFCDAGKQGQVCETTGLVVADIVTWNNVVGTHKVSQCTDSTLVACTGGFSLPTFSSGQTVSLTLNAAGDFFYRCDFHPETMKGKLVVAAAAVVTATPIPTGAASQAAGTATPTVTPAKVPATGGLSVDGSANWEYVLIGIGGVLIAGAAAAFVYTRNPR